MTPAWAKLMFGGIIALVPVIIFARIMPRMTPKGAKVQKDLLGFQEFIRRARGQELEWMNKKHPDQLLFESYLPHAVAFGLTAQWAEAFKDVLTEPPNWYHTPAGVPFTYLGFGSDLDYMTERVGSAASSPPQRSGSGWSSSSSGFSSGSSGGGFGGGGGGSW